MKNRPVDLVWSLKMIKRQSEGKDGCIIKNTGGFIANNQVDDLIEIVENAFLFSPNEVEVEYCADGRARISEKRNKAYDYYWSNKSMQRNE